MIPQPSKKRLQAEFSLLTWVVMRACVFIVTVLLAPLGTFSRANAIEPTRPELAGRFRDTVRPFLKSFCLECHSGEKPKGDFDLSAYSAIEAVERDSRPWARVLEKLKA